MRRPQSAPTLAEHGLLRISRQGKVAARVIRRSGRGTNIAPSFPIYPPSFPRYISPRHSRESGNLDGTANVSPYRDNRPRAPPPFAIRNPANPDSAENTPRKRTIGESERAALSARTRFARPISRRRLKRRLYPSWRIRSDMLSGFASPTNGRHRQTTFTAHPRAPTTRGCLGEVRAIHWPRRDAPSRLPKRAESDRRVISTPSFPRRAGERGLAVRSCDAVFNRRAAGRGRSLSLIPLLGSAGGGVSSPVPDVSSPIPIRSLRGAPTGVDKPSHIVFTR